MRGSAISRKRRGDRGSPWRGPRRTDIFLVLPGGVSKVLCAPLYGLATIKMKYSGMPRKRRVRSSYKWSAEGKRWVKSRYARRMSLLCVWTSSMQIFRWVMALEHDLPGRKPSCSGLMILFASM